MYIFCISEKGNYIHYIISCFKNSAVNPVNSSKLVDIYLVHSFHIYMIVYTMHGPHFIKHFPFQRHAYCLRISFLSFFLSFCLVFPFPLSSFLFFFLFLWWFLPHLHQSRQCSNKSLYTFLNFCKINPSPKVVTKYINRCFHITVRTSLQQSTLLSAMNESIYVFTSLPELKLSFFFIFVTSMGKKWCFL